MYLNQLEIRGLLDKGFDDFVDYINTLPDIRFTAALNGQWSAGQQLEHLVKSIRPICNVMAYPKLTLLYFGTSPLPSRSYDELSTNYRALLGNGCKSIKIWKPGITYPGQRVVLLSALLSLRIKLLDRLKRWTESDLDKYRLPHPLMGKLTIRETLYSIIYHTQHHLGKMQDQEPVGQSWENQLQQLIF
ncbi:DinB family protein [Chitinophaga silvatica]|nr:DinB family protein [Chitinophaga silvatica]